MSPPKNEQDVRYIVLPTPRREIPVERTATAEGNVKEHDSINIEGAAAEATAGAEGGMVEEEVEEERFAADEPINDMAATVQSMNLQEFKRILT